MKLGYQSSLMADMQFHELLDFPVPWARLCSSSLHNLMQS